ncbi:MAG TPA: pitrilysin family protein [Hyphomicrobiaceae bacterium]|jgi:zinc protease|nr:pitrilysin family protein [Hyphomicrobiaceae bacterium]
MKIQEVKSPGGITAWLVEEHSVPLIALRYAFDGGNAQDPAGKEGLANFLASMLDEGAGDLNAKQFQERMEEIAMRMAFDDARDAFYGSFETLTENRDKAVALLSLALNKPRFDSDAVDRIRGQLVAGLIHAARDPDRVASETWAATAFAGHPYGRPANGTQESIKTIVREDLAALRTRMFAKDTLRVVAVGDIDAATLASMLDQIFGGLPEKAKLTPVAQVSPKATEKMKVVEMAVPQSVARFGLPAMPRKDKDFLPAFVLNQILGGGVMSSRLWEEVREKRGLAYSVYTSVQPFKHTSVFAGGVATKNEEIGQSLDVINSELKRIAAEGPTATELANAKSYLVGSFALRFDTNAKIANQLLWILQEDLGKDYVDRRNGEIEAVTLDQVKAVAKRLFADQELITTIVGKPKGLAPRG